MLRIAAPSLALVMTVSAAFADVAEGLAALDIGDYQTAATAFGAAAQAGEADAHFYLGRMLELGMGGQPDPIASVPLYQRGADAGSALAQNRLGLLYLDGALVIQDYERAGELLCGAAEAGDTNGRFNCALMQLEGQGMEKNAEAALANLETASAANHIGAMNVLAQIYATGEVVPANTERAIELFQKTASYGNPVGLYSLGQAYVLGLGLDKDLVKAHAYFNLAAAQQHPEALQARQMLDQQLKAEEVAEAQRIARAWRPAEMPKAEAAEAPAKN